MVVPGSGIEHITSSIAQQQGVMAASALLCSALCCQPFLNTYIPCKLFTMYRSVPISMVILPNLVTTGVFNIMK